MTETVAVDRDVLAELDSIEAYLDGLIGDDPKPGQDANKKRLAGEFTAVRTLAQNVVELAAEYSRRTHKERLESSMGQRLDVDQVRHLASMPPALPYDASVDKARIAQLEAQLAALKGGTV